MPSVRVVATYLTSYFSFSPHVAEACHSPRHAPCLTFWVRKQNRLTCIGLGYRRQPCGLRIQEFPSLGLQWTFGSISTPPGPGIYGHWIPWPSSAPIRSRCCFNAFSFEKSGSFILSLPRFMISTIRFSALVARETLLAATLVDFPFRLDSKLACLKIDRWL